MTTPLDGRRILLTGGAGWLGRGVVAALTQGLADWPDWATPPADLRVRALVLGGETVPEEASRAGIEIVRGDLRSAADCQKLCTDAEGATLLHLAGLIHPGRIQELYDVNVEGTRNVLTAAEEAGVARAVIMSSNSPLGCNPHPDHLFDEESPYQPYMHYGRSKMQLEAVARDVRDRARIETVVIRAPWFYGPRQPPRQTTFFTMIRDGQAPILGGGENRRSMTFIDNLAHGLLQAAVVPEARGETYWIADERPYSMNEIVDTVEGLLENEFGQTCTHKRLRLPFVTGEIAGLVDAALQGVGLYEQKIHVLSEMNKTIACSVEKARRDLGYEPRIALEEGMRRSLRWLVENDGGIPA